MGDAGYAVRGVGQPFHSAFVNTVHSLCGYIPDTASSPPADGFVDALTSFVDNYGTHFINRWAVVSR